ncbi:MAG TPA: CocE/NonD family hydrolase, partial [Stellaceae bacterium]|nr:CocE/NonD family hydrolase [Stellaceae bacterium]
MTDWSLPPERPFRVIENDWIPMRDGTRLAVRLWLPEGSGPVPAVLEYIPYRKRDHYRQRDDAWGRLLARHGFAFARADVRGSGESEGVLLAEYTEQEQRDALDIIAWLAAREWCNGAVGMRGISWGGFNSFQVAAHAPPALKAIMPMCFSDRRFTDDAHYLGGALTHPNYGWGLMFKTVMAGPPDPAIVGERWKSMWLDRLHATPAILATWTAHQRADAYWQVGSVAPGYDRIRCAVYAVCGLADYFVNVAARVMGTLSVPRKCLIGPWAHDYPYSANPGPGLDWAHEEIRWWDEWLNGTDTGIMHEPMFRAYMADRTPAETYPQDVPGRWVAEAEWPSHRIGRQVLFMNHRGLSPQIEEPAELTCAGDRVVGTLQREVHEFYMPEDLPCDQTEDDRRSLTFDSPPLEADLEIMGNAVATIRVAADVPVAKLAVRLCEVTTEGKSWLVSYGILNLTHRDGHEHPVALEPGVPVTATIALLFTAHRFHTGSRIRVALSESLWPLAWPSPRVATLRITTG